VLVLIHRDLGSKTIRHFDSNTLVLFNGYFDLDVDGDFLGLTDKNFRRDALKLMRWYNSRRTINHPL
jgi:hypothetical protein